MAKNDNKPFQINTTPGKQVLVDSLTRDISLDACIFDLIDNAVDAARNAIFSRNKVDTQNAQLPDSYKGFEIKLLLDSESFTIQDNCGGIPLEDLKSSALRFGEPSAHTLGIGIFGIGLNRALFKIGTLSKIVTDTGLQRAQLLFDTEQYQQSKSWNVPGLELPTSGKTGTVIEIRNLPTDIARRFADKGETEKLRDEVGRTYARFIEKGLKISINKARIQSRSIEIRDDGPYRPDYKFYKTAEGVSIYIQSGQHVRHRFGAEPDYDKDVNRELTSEFGWTILCNDRVVISSNRTQKTGWYTKFHSEFYGFVGKVSFVGKPSQLPWSTTKADVDLNNPAYQVTLEDMRRFAEKWRSNATDAKKKKRRNEPLYPAPKDPLLKNEKKKAITDNAAVVIKKKFATKVDHNRFATILPQDIDERHCNDKHLALVHEAKECVLGEFVYSGLVLIRILIETTVVTYLIRHGAFDAFSEYIRNARSKEGKSDRFTENANLLPSLDEALTYLTNNPEIFGAGKKQYLKHSLARMQHHKKLLNSAAHNAFQLINRAEAFQIRDEVLPILRHLIED